MKALPAAIPVILIVASPAFMLPTLWRNPTSAGEDDVMYFYPVRKMVGEAIAAGRWPIRNDLEATGMPLLADPQAAVMYPPGWLFAVLPPKVAYALTLYLAFSVAGCGAYVYLRRLGLIRPAAAFGAVAFMFCGFLVGHRVHWSILHAGSFFPWGLWGIELLRGRAAAAFGVLVPVAYLALTAGHWPTLVHMGMAWAAYVAFRARPLWRAVGVAAGAAVVAGLIAAPQIEATLRLLQQVTRHRIGYAIAGENSFYPPAGVLGLFPLLFGSRTPGFYPQSWWGPWHLCEMLPYVGLSTLVLAVSAAWRLRKRPEGADGLYSEGLARPPQPMQPLVRVWTWMAAGALAFMLGYYLPTYRLVHMLPVLGMVRCPARMVLVLDMALAVLAAVAIDCISAGDTSAAARRAGAGGAAEAPAAPLSRTIRRGATLVLPAAMAAVLVGTAAAGVISNLWFGGQLLVFDGRGDDALTALSPRNPAVLVPIGLAIATGGVVRNWLRRPRAMAPLLVVLLLGDLFWVTRFVDVPADRAAAPDPEASAAAAWLKANAPRDEPFLVWGLAGTYSERPAELVRPKPANALGIATINSYGPFQSPAHAQLFGFQIFGTSRDWARLIRRNYLLSLYGVRYVVAARADARAVIESVRLRDMQAPRPPDGPNLLGEDWSLDMVSLARQNGTTLTLRSPMSLFGRWAVARQPVRIRPATVYRIALDARGPDGGAAHQLRAEIFRQIDRTRYAQADEWGLTIPPEQIGPDWRHFEWTFLSPASASDLSGEVFFRVLSASERPIEVRNVSLRESRWDEPLDLVGRLSAGEPAYRRLVELPAQRAGDEPVAVYENRLCLPAARRGRFTPARPEVIERLKWQPEAFLGALDTSAQYDLPTVGLAVQTEPRRTLLAVSVPACATYIAVICAWGLLRRRGLSVRLA